MILVLSSSMINLYLIACIYCTRKEVFPQSLDLASHLSLITLHPPLQLYSPLTSLCAFTAPYTLVSPCTLISPHNLVLLCTLVTLHTLAMLHLTSFPHITSPPIPTISISHRLLSTMPGDYPLPMNHTLRASLS